jgi:3-oxoacyl-[acyl-carrier protein] reductase
MDLHDSVSIVTGGAAGLGRALTLELARRGSHVVVLDPDAATADDTIRSAQAAGGTAETCIGDVRDDGLVAEAFALAASRGAFTYVVNNAGGWGGDVPFPDAEPDGWQAVLDLNLTAPMRLVQRALAALSPHGAVVTIASSAALGPSPYGSPAYAVAKAGMIRLTTSLAPHPVRVNAVVPGWIGLDRAHEQWAALTDEQRATMPPLIPVDTVTHEVVRLLVDTTLNGRVMVIEGDAAPRPL